MDKKYYVFSIIVLILSNISILLWGPGYLVEKEKIEAANFDQITLLHNDIYNIHLKLNSLNKEVVEMKEKGKIDEDYKVNLGNRFIILRDQFLSSERRCAELEGRERRSLIIPDPLRDKLPPKLVGAQVIDSTNIIEFF